MKFTSFKNFILDILFPIQCLSCQREFENLEPRERWICGECLEKIKAREEQVCPVCEKPSEGGGTHYQCQKETFLDGLWVATEYDCKTVSEAIHKLKFNFIKDISFPLSKIMKKSVLEIEEFGDFQDLILANFSKETEEKIYLEKEKNEKRETVVAPVPLHKRRYNWRGFNQAFLLSSHIVLEFKLPIRENLLLRVKNTKPQTKIKSMQERKENIKGAFFCPEAELAKNKNIILIDDVCTTLATLNECAKELKKAKANKIWGLVVARR